MVRSKYRPRNRRLMPNFPSSGPREMPGFYTHMFIQDVHSGIMGYRLNDDGDQHRRIRVAGEEEVTVVEALCASLARGAMYNISKTIESAIESVALHLAWSGQAVYEICKGDAKELSLESVPPYHLFRVPTAFMQLVPREDRRWSGGRRYAVLPISQAWVVRMPKSLGGANGYRRLLKRLQAFSATGPEFWNRDLQAGKFNSDFSFSDYTKMQAAAVARITRAWGWNRRDTSSNFDTEFFYFHRSLRFRRAQAMLRDHIVAQFNCLLSRLDINARIELEGYPSPQKIEELIEAVSAGTLHYADAFKQAG
jgi:hypothetical protein